MKSEKMHIRHVMHWKFKQGHSAKAIAKKLCSVYVEGLMTVRAVRNWFVKFLLEDTTLQKELRTRRPSDFDDNLLKLILKQNPEPSTRNIANRLSTSQSTVCRPLKKLGKVGGFRNMKPHNLGVQNKEGRISIATSLLLRVKIKPFLDKIYMR